MQKILEFLHLEKELKIIADWLLINGNALRSGPNFSSAGEKCEIS